MNRLIAVCNADYVTGVVKIDRNYALDKVTEYHKSEGDTVVKYNPLEHWNTKFDQVYMSSIFTFTDKSVFNIDKNWICGGTGIDVKSKLPDYIENLRPKKNYGFCSRGCIRNCKFCVVRQKEGYIRADADITDLWDGESKSVLLQDNNILAIPDHFIRICEQLKKYKIKVDFNQGLDIRLVDNDIAKALKGLSHEEYRFAFDSMAIENTVRSKIEILKKAGINRAGWYVILGFDTTIEEDIYRMELLRSYGQRVFPMPYKKVTQDMPNGVINNDNRPLYEALENYGYDHAKFSKMDFLNGYLDSKRGKVYKKLFKEKGLVA